LRGDRRGCGARALTDVGGESQLKSVNCVALWRPEPKSIDQQLSLALGRIRAAPLRAASLSCSRAEVICFSNPSTCASIAALADAASWGIAGGACPVGGQRRARLAMHGVES
jgi:hypothetical protein